MIKRKWLYYPQWRSALWTSITELFLPPTFNNSCPSVTKDQGDLSKSHNYEAIMSLPPDVEHPIERFEWGTQIFKLVILLTLSSSKLIVIFSNFGQVKLDPTCSFLLTLGKSVFTDFGQDVRLQKNQPKQDMAHRIWHKTFSMIQSVGIKNWVPQLIIRLQRFNILFLFVQVFLICATKKNMLDKNKDTKCFT